jgi:trigger factor
MIPGFEDGIWHGPAGEERVLDVTFPEDYRNEDLLGQQVEFKVQVKEVKTVELAPVDEALFAQYGLEDGTEESSFALR